MFTSYPLRLLGCLSFFSLWRYRRNGGGRVCLCFNIHIGEKIRRFIFSHADFPFCICALLPKCNTALSHFHKAMISWAALLSGSSSCAVNPSMFASL